MERFGKHIPHLGFAIATIILIAVGGLAVSSLSAFMQSAQNVAYTLQVIRETETTLTLLLDSETGQRGYVITGDDVFLEPYNAAVAPEGIAFRIQQLRQLTADNPNQQQRLDVLEIAFGSHAVHQHRADHSAPADQSREFHRPCPL